MKEKIYNVGFLYFSQFAGIIPFLLLVLLVSGISTIPSSAYAQTPDKPFIDVVQVASDQFPIVQLSVHVNNVSDAPDNLPILVKEQGEQQAIVHQVVETVGIQTAIVVDAHTILSTTQSSNALLFDIGMAVTDFILTGNPTTQPDWMAAYSLDGDAIEPMYLISDWNWDRGAVVNTLSSFLKEYQLNEARAALPLDLALLAILEQFDVNPAISANWHRSLVLFSSDVDRVDPERLEPLIKFALDRNVRIFVVKVGTEQEEDNGNLAQLAQRTFGQYVSIDGDGNLSLPIWQQIAEGRTQWQISYRSHSQGPAEIELIVSPENGESLSTIASLPHIELTPVQVEVIQPQTDVQFVQPLQASESTEASLPAELEIEVKFIWPDGHPRALRQVEYLLNEGVLRGIRTEEPFGSFRLPISNLAVGKYLMGVKAIDEFGLESAPVPISFQIAPPPASISTPTNVSQALDDSASVPSETIINPEIEPDLLTIAGVGDIKRSTLTFSVLTILALLVLIFIWLSFMAFRDYRARSQLSALSGQQRMDAADESELTEILHLPKFYVAPAWLIHETGGDNLPPRLKIDALKVRIGRKGSECDQVLNDPRISRLHATIKQEGNEKFYLMDEGSTGGTYVNRRKLGVQDKQLLHHEDIINFHEITYRFVLTNEVEPTE